MEENSRVMTQIANLVYGPVAALLPLLPELPVIFRVLKFVNSFILVII